MSVIGPWCSSHLIIQLLAELALFPIHLATAVKQQNLSLVYPRAMIQSYMNDASIRYA